MVFFGSSRGGRVVLKMIPQIHRVTSGMPSCLLNIMDANETPVIEVENFTRNYGEFAAVIDLSFAVHPGEIVGLVGANGAGKTTTLRAITGILRPSAGTIRVGGHDIERAAVEAKRAFAYIPDTVHPYDVLTVTEHLHFVALAYRISNAETKYAALLEELELKDKKDEIASSLSRGMLQKLSLACAFLREPRVIILDEPLTGLDPRGIRNIKESVRRRAACGTAFLLSSHLLVLVETLCDQVMILHRGKKMAFGSLQEIRHRATLHKDASLEDVFFAVTERPSESLEISNVL
jgi:ABC-2 type transport system ATP-binding protein